LIWKCKIISANIILERKSKLESVSLPDFNTSYKATIANAMKYISTVQHKNNNIGLEAWLKWKLGPSK
jgi:hypothetical protein